MQRISSFLNAQIEDHGFAFVPGFLSGSECDRLIKALGPVTGAGRRGLLSVPTVAELAGSPRLIALIRPYLPIEPRPVRAIYFDKAPGANWPAPWHQDLMLPVDAPAEVPGFGPRSLKDGVPHVQPPVELLERMLTVRLHLDACNESNGALRVLPGTHRYGRLSSERIAKLREELPGWVCRASLGDVLLMRPLLLHASRRSHGEGHRRVLHIEFAAFELPRGLRFHEAA
ncbi:MAG: hypothetical protein QOJ40_693 [Verrucomicrobiota bacterium]